MLLRSFKQVGGASRFRLGLTASAAGVLAVTLSLILVPTAAHAATDPVLGDANSFAVLSSTYTNTATGTTMTGDLGYTTPPAVAATVNGNTYQPPSGYYTQAGIDQGTALANLNGQACTFTFGAGAVDLATDTTHGALGIYLPGVYCTDTLVSSAASIGTAGITLTGAGTYIFKVNGALTSLTTSSVRLAGGASSCDVWWDPIGATTLGSPSTFAGTDIDASGITVGAGVLWTGRALAFGGTVTTATDTISNASCYTPPVAPPVATTSCAVTSLLAASTSGQAVTFTAFVTGTNPTGTVLFADDGTTLGSSALIGGQATLTSATLAVGTHSIWAFYAGDGGNAACSSARFIETVGAPTTPTTTPTPVVTAPVPVVTTPTAVLTTAPPAAKPRTKPKKTAPSGSTLASAAAPPAAPGVPTAPTSPIVPTPVSVTG